MSQAIKILNTALASNDEQVEVHAVSYRDSAAFSGIFAVDDIETCMYTDPETGKSMINVICQFGTAPFDEDARLSLDLLTDPSNVLGINGGGVDVITRISY